MKKPLIPRRLTRRDFIKLGGSGALATLVTGTYLLRAGGPDRSLAAPMAPSSALSAPPARPKAQMTRLLRLAATDGFFSFPGRRIFSDPDNVYDPNVAPYNDVDPEVREAARREAIFNIPDDHNGLYGFGFVGAAVPDTIAEVINKHKGRVQHPAPIIGVDSGDELYITVTNLGLVGRPDLDDSHTVHWHGFDNPNAVFDGVPEVSIAVPPARDFAYFFRPRREGTYMYHCHFEDSEHVQMGMDGIVFIRPDPDSYPNHAYPDGSTAFDREYTLLFNELDTTPHDNLINVQEFIWSDYDPNYWVINGRTYPDTILTEEDIIGTELEYRQPISSLIQANSGDTVLLRMSSLGYQQQAMQLLGGRLTVIGHDSNFLGPLTYNTHTIYIGPGESRDALFSATYDASLPGGTDSDGRNYNVYWFKNHQPQRLVNGSHENDNLADPNAAIEDIYGTDASLGGQITQIRVYQGSPLDPQTRPNETFGPSS